jgi:hypothetical protein
MRMTNRYISTLGAIVVAVAGLTACGGGKSDVVVARVSGVGAISKATLDHWIPIEAVVIYREHPAKPVPKGLIPDPPDYPDCIAYLKVTPQKVVETGPKPSIPQLKLKCIQRYRELKELTLNTLIGWDWTLGAGIELGLTVSDAEARQWLKDENKKFYPKDGEFAKYLRLTGQTVSDLLFRSKVQLAEVKLVKKRTALEKSTPKGLTARQQQETPVVKFSRAMPPSKGWAARTTCLKGYVVSACKEYTGSESPGLPN